MKVGADPKKIVILGGLVLVLAFIVISNVKSDDQPVARASTPSAAPAADPADSAPVPAVRDTRLRPRPRQADFGSRNRRIDVTTIDPTLRLDLLARVESVDFQGGQRNLFQFGAAPLPPKPEPKIIPKAVPSAPITPVAAVPAQPVKPPPPPIPLKFYGYANAQPGAKRAFFLLDDDIIVAAEGELVKRRYKVIKVNINSCVVEDMEYTHEQTLPLEEQPG
jgi:hypothetical protein